MHSVETGFVLIYTSPNPNSINIAKSLLESEGIPCTIEGEITNQVMSGYVGTTWIKLFIPVSEAERSGILLKEAGFTPESAEAEDEGRDGVGGSTGTAKLGRQITLILIAILLVLGLLGLYTYFVQ